MVKKSSASRRLYLGIDVGTGSARCGVFDEAGQLHGVAKHDIPIYRQGRHVVEQATDEIWQAVVRSVRGAIELAGADADEIRGLGFDATCSLAVIGRFGAPLAVGQGGESKRNVMVWMDHRAGEQAERINATRHSVLKHVGGVISPEMQTPKLLWLKENVPETYEQAEHYFDLTDYLTWRATGSAARSLCTVTCKWTYLAHERHWDADYFSLIGLGDLANDHFRRIGSDVADVGSPLGDGLSTKAARELGLLPGTPVGAGLIDAHAGGLGTIGTSSNGEVADDRMAYVFGTSACTLAISNQPIFVPGVWGPFASAIIPGFWLNEGGQSAAGAAIAHLLSLHPLYEKAAAMAADEGKSLPDWIVERACERVDNPSQACDLAGEVLVVPEFLGNRAPFGDQDARAIIAGLDLDTTLDSLIAIYVSCLLGLGYGLRQILRAQGAAGLQTRTIVISGGAGESEFVRQLLSDACGCPIQQAATSQPVLLGSAILGAVACGRFPNLQAAMKAMSALGKIHYPAPETKTWHLGRFRVFEAFQDLYKTMGSELRKHVGE